MKKNLIVTGGIFHPFEETSNSLSNILSEMDYVSEITLDLSLIHISEPTRPY